VTHLLVVEVHLLRDQRHHAADGVDEDTQELHELAGAEDLGRLSFKPSKPKILIAKSRLRWH
jgi:hypothetical protein